MSSCTVFVFLSLIEYAFVNVMMGDISEVERKDKASHLRSIIVTANHIPYHLNQTGHTQITDPTDSSKLFENDDKVNIYPMNYFETTSIKTPFRKLAIAINALSMGAMMQSNKQISIKRFYKKMNRKSSIAKILMTKSLQLVINTEILKSQLRKVSMEQGFRKKILRK